jgi:hypothetical protein
MHNHTYAERQASFRVRMMFEDFFEEKWGRN